MSFMNGVLNRLLEQNPLLIEHGRIKAGISAIINHHVPE
jgi:hypothetical protein